MDSTLRIFTSCQQICYSKSDTDPLYVNRINFGNGLIQLNLTFKIYNISIKKKLSRGQL